MTDERDPLDTHEADESPDFLAAPKRGKGVRRLNRRPLFIVGGLVLLAVLAICYTFFQRRASMTHVATPAVEPGSVSSSAAPPVRPDASGPPVPPANAGNPPTVPAMDANGAPTGQGAVPPEVEARRRLIAQIEEHRIAQAQAALGSDAGVQSFAARDTNNNGGNGVAPGQGGMTPAQLAGLEGANRVYREAAANGAGSPTVPGLQGGGAAGLAGIAGIAGRGPQDQNQQDHKRAFLANAPDTDTYLKHTRNPAISPENELKAGTVIPGVMISGVDSDLPGQVIGQVRQNVYDTATGKRLLVPAGARLVGTYDSTVTMGQSRALVAWSRIIYPDGSSVSLDLMPGTDQGGYAGFHDQVNNHYWKIFGNALLLSAFSAGIQLSQPQATNGQNYNSQQVIAGSLGQQLGQVGMAITQRGLNIQPTLKNPARLRVQRDGDERHYPADLDRPPDGEGAMMAGPQAKPEGSRKVSVMNNSRQLDKMIGGEWVTLKVTDPAGLPRGVYQLSDATRPPVTKEPVALSGQVLHLDYEKVYQLHGDGIAVHDRAAFRELERANGPLAIGQAVTVTYQHGRGMADPPRGSVARAGPPLDRSGGVEL